MNYYGTMSNCDIKIDKTQLRPSSPRQFFARLYGHLETNNNDNNNNNNNNNENQRNERSNENNKNSIPIVDKNCSMESSLTLKETLNITYEKNVKVLSQNDADGGISTSDLSKSDERIENIKEKSESAKKDISHMLLKSPFTNLPIGFPSETTFPENLTAFFARRRRKDTKQRRQRTTFSNEQTLLLEVEFHRNEYITRTRRLELAEHLNLSDIQIKIWFQNRRAKDKRIEKAQIDQQYRNFMIANGFMNSFIGQRSSHYPSHFVTDFQQNSYQPHTQALTNIRPNICLNHLSNDNTMQVHHHMLQTHQQHHISSITTATSYLSPMNNSTNADISDNHSSLNLLNRTVGVTNQPFKHSIINIC